MKILNGYLENMFRRVMDEMFNEKSVEMYLNQTAVRKIEGIYEGNPYWLDHGMKSSGKGKTALAVLSNKITLEFKSDIVAKDEDTVSYKQMDRAYKHLIKNTRKYIEQFIAYGYGAFKVFSSNGKLGVEFVTGDRIVPLRFDDFGELCEVIFITRSYVGNKLYSKLDHHNFKYGESYTIRSSIREGNGINPSGNLTREITNIEETPMWRNSLASLDIHAGDGNIVPEHPFFVYCRTPIASLNSNNRIGDGSLLLNAEAHLSSYDYMYNRYLNEYEMKKPRVIVPTSMLDQGPVSGTPRSMAGNMELFKDKDDDALYMELKREIYVKYPERRGEDNEINIFAPNIDNESIESGLDFFLREIESSFGLAFGELSKSETVVKTATEIEASKERSYSTVIDYQDIIKETYSKIVAILEYRAYINGYGESGDYELTFDFDDSIAIGRRDHKRAFEEVQAGIISPESYLMKTRGITYEQALVERKGSPFSDDNVTGKLSTKNVDFR